jgi:hypothetical protein
VTGFHRFTILAIAALLAAGCGASPASTSTPTSQAAPPASPNPIPEPLPTAGATDPAPVSSYPPTFSTTCPDLPDGYRVPRASLNPQIGWLSFEFTPNTITPHTQPEVSFAAGPNLEAEIGLLPGGHAMPIELWLWYQFDPVSMGPIKVVSVTATVHIDGRSPKHLKVEWAHRRYPIWDLVATGMPDVDATASIEVGIEWTDRCFTYSGATTVEGVQLVSTTTTTGCRMSKRGYNQDFDAALAAPLSVGSNTTRLVSTSSEARYLPIVSPGIDVHPAWGWDPDAPPIVAAPGEFLTIRRDEPGFELLSMDATGWTRRNFADQSDVWPPRLDAVFDRAPDRQPDGSFRFRVPSDTGRYVAGLSFPFEWTCGTGQAWSVFSLDIVESALAPPDAE